MAHVVLAAVKQLILRPGEHENGFEMYKNKKARAKRAKLFL